jgi:hypothetical protein
VVKNNSNKKFGMIKEVWAQNKISKANMLHPKLYKYIRSSKVRNLIMDVDLHKYNTRKNGARGFVSNWGKEQNRLHRGKKFLGSWTKKHPGALPREIVNMVKSFHGVKDFSFSNSRLAGFADGEFSMSVYLNGARYTRLHVRCAQNRRNRQLLSRVQDFFGGVGGFYRNMWENSSSIEWKSNGYKRNMGTVALKLREEVPFQTVKAKQNRFFLGRISAYKRNMAHSEIRRLYGFTQNKDKLTSPKSTGL